MTAVTVSGTYTALPDLGEKLVCVAYTKAAQNDTIDMSSYGLKTIHAIWATVAASGIPITAETVTATGTTITLTGATTGVGAVMVWGL